MSDFSSSNILSADAYANSESMKQLIEAINNLANVHIDEKTMFTEALDVVSSKWSHLTEDEKDEISESLGGKRDKETAKKLLDGSSKKKTPEIMLSARIGTVELHCKKCGAHLTNLIPKQYSPYRNGCSSEYKAIEKMPTIKYDIVSDIPCDRCGCNLFDADIKIAINVPKINKTDK